MNWMNKYMATTINEYKGIGVANKQASGLSENNQSSTQKSDAGGNLYIFKAEFEDIISNKAGKLILILDQNGGVFKFEGFFGEYSKRMDTSVNIFDSWERFLKNVDFFKTDEIDSKFKTSTDKFLEAFKSQLESGIAAELFNIAKGNKDYNIRNLMAKERLSTFFIEIAGNKDIQTEIVIDVIVPEAEKVEEKAGEKSKGFEANHSNYSFMAVTPIIDPVNGLSVHDLRVGHQVMVENPEKKSVMCQVSGLTPSDVEDRIVVYVQLEENVIGKMVLSRTTMLMKPEEEKKDEISNETIGVVIFVVAAVLLFIGWIIFALFV